MTDEEKSREQLIGEVVQLRNKVGEYEKTETRRQQTEEELHRQLNFNRVLMESCPAFFLAIDPQGKIFFMNEVMTKALGYSPDEVIGTDYRETLAPADSRESISRMFRMPSREYAAAVTRNRVRTKDGRELLVEWNARPVPDANGNSELMFGVGFDITDRKRQEGNRTPNREGRESHTESGAEELQKSRKEAERHVLERAEKAFSESDERCRVLMQHSLTGMYIHQNGRFVFVNKRLADILDRTPADMMGHGILEFVHPEDRDMVKASARTESPATHDVPHFEFRVLTRDGKTKWVEVLATTIQYNGGTAHMGNVADITERKAYQQQLIDKIKTIDDLYEHILQTGKAKAIAEHTANVAHELRQPLTIIGGFARRLEKKCAPLQTENGQVDRDGFPIVINEVRRLEQILGRLIDFTRPQGVTLSRADPHKLIQYVLRIYQELVQEKGLHVQVNLSKHVGEMLLDQLRFQQVVRNLVANAIEASPRNDTIKVETRISRPSEKARDTGGLTHATFFQRRIGNHGDPIPQEELEKIFNPFFTTKEFATGLGLTLSRKIIRDHKGSISVKSDATGTVFTVWLPFQPQTN